MENYGANPPTDQAWQMGKTAATIAWVKYLADKNSPNCQETIEALKNGSLVAMEFPPGW